MGVQIGVHNIAPRFVPQLALSCFRILEGAAVFLVCTKNRGFRVRNECWGRGARQGTSTDTSLDHPIMLKQC